MATRGPKPKAPILKLVTNNPGDRPFQTVDEPDPEDIPVKPTWLDGRGAELWGEVLKFASWLTVADSYKLAAWCDRQSEFEQPKKRKKWTAADRREHRTAGSELGLDYASRLKMGKRDGNAKKKDPARKYF